MCYTRFCAVINMIISTIGVLLGLLIFIACLFYYSKYNAALWGLFSAVFSAGCLHLQRLRYQRKLNTWYTTKQLESLQSFGLFFFLISVVACGVYLSLAIVRHQAIISGLQMKYQELLSVSEENQGEEFH